MPSVGNTIRISSRATLRNQLCMNVFFYTLSVYTGSFTISAILADFGLWITTNLKPLQHPSVTYFELEWYNVNNPAELVREPSAVVGSAAGDCLPNANAWQFRLFGNTAITRSGWKRVAGVTESDQVAGQPSGTAPTRLATAAAAMLAPFQDAVGTPGDEYKLLPVILGRTAVGGYDLSRVNPVVDVKYGTEITTQNTRKIGRGA